MSKEEFLLKLRQALNGAGISAGVVQENIRYYDDYISGEAAKGQKEEDVIAEIGDPRLIAKTIEETTDSSQGGTEEYYQTSDDSGQTYEETNRSSEQENPFAGQSTFQIHNLNKWYWKLLIILVPCLIIAFFFIIVTGIFAILRPILGPLCMILMVVWLWKGIFNNRY